MVTRWLRAPLGSCLLSNIKSARAPDECARPPTYDPPRRLGECCRQTGKSCSVFRVATCRACEAVRVKCASVVGVCVWNPCLAATPAAPAAPDAAPALRCAAGVPPVSCSFSFFHDTCGLRLPVRAQPQASMSVSRTCFIAHVAALPSFSGTARPQPTCSEVATPFCAAASSNGALPTPSGRSQQYSLPLGDAGRKTKGKQTTHTIRAQSH